MKVRSVIPMRIAKWGYIILSCIFCLVGITMTMLPEISIQVIGKILGVTLMCFGIVKLIGYFSKDLYRLAFQFDLQFGILLIVLGAILLLNPGNVLDFICISFGVSMMADGLFKIKIAFESQAFGIKSWWLILGLSLLTCFIGLLLVFRPSQSIRVITMILGVSLFAEGILNFSVAISLVKIIKNQKPEIIDADYSEIDDSFKN